MASKNDRRAAVDKIRRDQKRADQRQGFIIVMACVLVAVGIVGTAAFLRFKSSYVVWTYRNTPLAEIGAKASACGEITTSKSEGNSHVPTEVEYKSVPAVTGNHDPVPDDIDRKLYTEDRPPLEELVHNQEHGYTIVWYDEYAEDHYMNDLRGIASKFPSDTNFRDKFKVVPWTDEDGKAFPKGQHIAITHWSRGGVDVAEGDRSKEVGVFQFCSEPSGAALEDFMQKYPYLDSPEPSAG